MYETAGPVLVLHEPTYHPILEHHTGYIFGLYDFHMRKPRELFFQHFYEAVTYAAHLGAKVELDSKRAPEKLTSIAYLEAQLDDSRFAESSDMRDRVYRAEIREREGSVFEPDRFAEAGVGDVTDISYFGD